MSAPLKVVLDGQQRRAWRDRVILVAGHRDWSSRFRQDVWLDPVTNTLALAPMVYRDGWRTSSAGEFRRLRLGEFTGSNLDKWYEHDRGTVEGGGDWFLCNTTTNDVLTTSETFPPNQGWHIAYYPANVGDERYIHLECGWGTAVSLRFWSDGVAEVWKGETRVGEHNYKGADGSSAQTAYDCVNLLLLPWRLRELLVVSNQSGGFAHSFDDLLDDEEGQEIVPSSRFWVEVPVGAAQLQVAPVSYAASGYACSRLGIFNGEPSGGSVESRVIGWGSATASLVEGDDPEASYSSGTRARVRVDLSGGGVSTPHVIGATAGIGPTTAQTSDEPLYITEDLTRVDLDITENPGGAAVSLSFKWSSDPDDLTERLAAQNRPAALELGDLPFFDGFTEPAERDIGTDLVGTTVRLSCRDRWRRFETYLFRDEIPLDGMTLAEAFRFVAAAAGEDETTLVIGSDAESFLLPVPDGDGQWSNDVRVGDSAADWLLLLHETYCGSWFLGFKPDPEEGYRLHIEPQSRSQASLRTLYARVEDAVLIAGVSEEEAVKHVYRSYRETRLEPECNIVNVVGLEPSTKRPILVTFEDERSLDPTIPRAQRPENWLGEPRSYGFGDPAITTLATAERAAHELYNLLTWPRWLAEVECELLTREVEVGEETIDFPLWRGDAVTLDGIGVFRIVAFGCSFVVETEERQVRRANYTLEYLRPQDAVEDEEEALPA